MLAYGCQNHQHGHGGHGAPDDVFVDLATENSCRENHEGRADSVVDPSCDLEARNGAVVPGHRVSHRRPERCGSGKGKGADVVAIAEPDFARV